MQSLLNKLRGVCYLLIITLIGEFLLPFTAISGNNASVKNISFVKSGKYVIINYDLFGSSNEEFQITVTMRKRSDTEFEYVPKNAFGDIGTVRPGMKKRISWSVQQEIAGGIDDKDNYFVIVAESNSSGVSPLIWIGGAAVIGGVAYIILSKKGDDGSNNNQNFPLPPDRPPY
jgi:hypothetical protein